MPPGDNRAQPRRRRTQEERRAETQAKVLDATIRSVLEHGYAQTTTRQVASLAGVSAGAMAHYYPRRADLVAAAIERLVEQRLDTWRSTAPALRDGSRNVTAALLDLLWADFSSPLFTVVVKLWVAAADDSGLYMRLAEAERQMAHEITTVAVQAAGDLGSRAGWEGRLRTVLAAVRGLALMEHFQPRVRRQPDPWPETRRALTSLLDS
jgi:AcrR family transcriptional regulator